MKKMIFKYLLRFCVLLFTIFSIGVTVTFSQSSSLGDSEILVGRYDFPPWSEYEELYQYNESITDAFNLYQANRGSFAIKLCSQLPFAKSFLTSIINPRRIVFDLTHRPTIAKISEDKITIVNSSKCTKKNVNRTVVELWWFKDKSPFIEKSESLKPCQIKYLMDKAKNDFKNDAEYRESLKLLGKEFRLASKNSEVAGEILGTYYRKVSPLLKKKLAFAKKLFANEIRDGMITVSLHKITLPDGSIIKRKEPNFPSISALQILKDCSSNTENQ